MLTYILSMSACLSIPKSLKNSFTYCYDGKYTGIDTLINIDGYYKEMFLNRKSPTIGGFLKDTSLYYIDTTYHYFMFYNNGLYVYNIRDIYYDYSSRKWVKKDVSSFLKDFSKNSEAIGAKSFYGNSWGNYIISGDTIKVQRISKAMSLNDNWQMQETWYKIIDKNTILCINIFNLPITLVSQPRKRERFPITFSPIPTKPDYNKSWILREKWFWCDEQDWKDYMEKIKKKMKMTKIKND